MFDSLNKQTSLLQDSLYIGFPIFDIPDCNLMLSQQLIQLVPVHGDLRKRLQDVLLLLDPDVY